MSACLLLIRHGQASFDSDDYDRLSDLGVQQARALPAALEALGRGHGLVRCISAGQRRHQQTAAALLDCHPDLEMETDPELREFDHREIFHAHRPDLRDPDALQAWKAAPGDYGQRFESTWRAALTRWMGGEHAQDYQESWIDFRARCLRALTIQLDRLGDGESAVVVTSSGPLSVLIQACWSVPDAALAAVQSGLYNTGLTELWRDPGQPPPGRLGQVNACAHLQAGALRSRR